MVDLNLKENEAIINNEIDYILQQIDLLFDTTPKEVLGDSNFGTKYDDYLYDLKFSAAELENAVYQDLYNKLDLLDWKIKVKVYLLDGSERDIILINIDIYKGSLSREKTYRIE